MAGPDDIKAEINRQNPDQTCPRRMQEARPASQQENQDYWERQIGKPHCSYCGSLHPDEFMAMAEAGVEIIPTDKSYKCYLVYDTGTPRKTETTGHVTVVSGGRHQTKFYYQHLSTAQRARFIELYNSGSMKVGHPGRFYVLPFFCQSQEHRHD